MEILQCINLRLITVNICEFETSCNLDNKICYKSIKEIVEECKSISTLNIEHKIN